MIETALGRRYAMTAPHRIATKAGADVMEAGGSAIEAMVAAAAMISAVYPHMNGIGGDAFWLIKRPGQAPVSIMGCGGAAGLATPEWYTNVDAIPSRGPKAALTVPGAVGSWQAALDQLPGGHIPLVDLLAPAVAAARDGVATSRHQAGLAAAKLDQLQDVPGFAEVFLDQGQAPTPGAVLRQTALAATLETIGRDGVDSFYTGDIAQAMAAFLEQVGSPLRAGDLAAYAPKVAEPLSLKTKWGTLYNTQAPTQGMASLAILGIFERLGITTGEGFDHIHGAVESIKRAYRVRNAELGDPAHMRIAAQELLQPERLDALAAEIDPKHAMDWPEVAQHGDTIWMGAADADGTVVSFIQSIFWEFGSGLTCPTTGVLFQNRGADFTLTPGVNQLAPGKVPFHTLNPALAELSDGRVMAYGTQGGEGQPQTQAAIFTRYAAFDTPLQQAITAPRWLLGKSWGEDSTTLKVEADFGPELIEALRAAGHELEVMPPHHGVMGQAGAVVRHNDGLVEAATDPRSDGAGYAR
ncbi:gamma-glutamyltransferase [Epibacterium sp. SM1979]|uniref:Gamma-glutamyltransferase n=1 Tax=Tritonibacter litoralis TaxID=2662264 RepID=A0A843YIC3_9RHOB|nr:gamma-glutamyltransferase family protein [Tritonibacter litoralis]MQQ08973.1 gamma-glutamyltransferase [Tritonibacter litoralis]